MQIPAPGALFKSVILLQEYDKDDDGLFNDQEGIYGTDPKDPDTDNDGLNDYEEITKYHTNPL